MKTEISTGFCPNSLPMDTDVPWDVEWTKNFEESVEGLKESGRWDQVKSRIEKIVNNPARTGEYKDGALKGIRTTHLSEKVIGWKIIPGVSPDLQHKVEALILLFIVHHDEMGIGFTHENTVEKAQGFEVELPYYGGFEMQRKINDIYNQANEADGFRVQEPDWEAEKVIVSGTIPEDKRPALESVLPESAEVDYENDDLLD